MKTCRLIFLLPLFITIKIYKHYLYLLFLTLVFIYLKHINHLMRQ